MIEDKRRLGGPPLRVCTYCKESTGIILQYTQQIEGVWVDHKAHEECEATHDR